MPIRPPNLDDRRYEDIVREARALIPQYTPEWTNLSDADPGMTLVQLFAWMTEMIIFRVNQVPDKTYIHFLNFIGEERKTARPAVAPLTFTTKGDRHTDIPAFTRCATRQREDSTAADYLTVEPITVHDASITRVVAARGGTAPAVRDVPFALLHDNPSALAFGAGRGVDLFDLDPVACGPDAYTPGQYLYVGHDDIARMGADDASGRLRIRRPKDGLSIAALFDWEYPRADGWALLPLSLEPEDVLGMPEVAVSAVLPGLVQLDTLPVEGDALALPAAVRERRWWLRGRLDYERFLAERARADLEVDWRDDRGGEERALNTWECRANGRALEFFLQDLPPIRGGWTLRFSFTDRRLPAGRHAYLPRYRWSYRRGDGWEDIPPERVHGDGRTITLTGPLTEMASDGYNLRAERVETVIPQAFLPDLEMDVSWVRPIELAMFQGDDVRRLETMPVDEGPWSPFQIAPVVPPTLGRKWFIGSDLFANRPQKAVLVEVDVAFEMNGEAIAEPVDDYLLQLTYRAADNWRVVWSEDKRWTSFTFASLDAAEGRADTGKTTAVRTVRFSLDPKTQLKELAVHAVGRTTTAWIRFELVKSSLTATDAKKQQFPIIPRIHAIRLGVDDQVGVRQWEQPLPEPAVVWVDHRPANRRLTRVTSRWMGQTREEMPFDAFVDITDPNQSVYLHFDQALPPGRHHAVQVRTRGESFLPEGVHLAWEVLEDRGAGRFTWRRLHAPGDDPGATLLGPGTLRFALPEGFVPPAVGFWLRARFAATSVDLLPRLPALTHLLLNTVDVVNLITVRTERFSGLGVPSQLLQLRKHPVYLHDPDRNRSAFRDPSRFPDIRVLVEAEDGQLEEWSRVEDAEMLVARKDDRVFVVDPVDGTLTFGNGIHGRMLPPGSSNVVVDTYRHVPGGRGNVGVREINVVEGYADLVRCENLLPASGGRDAETIDEIVRRAPTLLTSRDRAVTRADFELLATEASGEVARASCDGKLGADGTIPVIILPRRRDGERVPDPMLSAGLVDHVHRFLKRRCLVNVEPAVRLARFLPVDVSVQLRLRAGANLLLVRENAARWVERFLDPYEGGLDGVGWPFGGTLYAQDFARMVTNVEEVRHVVDVQLFPVVDPNGPPGWEAGEGARALGLEGTDLFAVRRVRVQLDEGA